MESRAGIGKPWETANIYNSFSLHYLHFLIKTEQTVFVTWFWQTFSGNISDCRSGGRLTVWYTCVSCNR